MIIVKVEQHDTVARTVRTIGVMALHRIPNEADPSLPHFDAKFARETALTNPQATVGDLFSDPDKAARVENFPRDRVSVWKLVQSAIASAFPSAD